MIEKILHTTTIQKHGTIYIPERIKKIIGTDIIYFMNLNNNIMIQSSSKPIKHPGTVLDTSRIGQGGIVTIHKRVRDLLNVNIGNDIIFVQKDDDIIVQSSVKKEEDIFLLRKVEIATELICKLYENNFIEDAFIVGPVATGTVTKKSEIGIVIVNPLFESTIEFFFLQINFPEEDKKTQIPSYEEIISDFNPIVGQIVEFLENTGVRSYLSEKELTPEVGPEPVIYQTYKGELIQIWEIGRAHV